MTGVHVVNIEGRLHKHTIDQDGRQKSTTDDNKHISQDLVVDLTVEGLKNKEGCRIEGEVKIHKVPGNFHISSHSY